MKRQLVVINESMSLSSRERTFNYPIDVPFILERVLLSGHHICSACREKKRDGKRGKEEELNICTQYATALIPAMIFLHARTHMHIYTRTQHKRAVKGTAGKSLKNVNDTSIHMGKESLHPHTFTMYVRKHTQLNMSDL